MENNTSSPARDCQSPNPHRLTVLAWKNAVGSYRILADQLGIKHGESYLSNFVNHGTEPGTREIRDRMGIMDTDYSYTRSRNARLKQKARVKNWDSLSQFLTAVLHGEAEIPRKEG